MTHNDRTDRRTRARTTLLVGAMGASLLLGGFAVSRPTQAHDTPAVADATPKWAATGTLFESCTCAVPCTCNFGQGPSPHMYCYAVFAYRLDKASFDGVDLSGLVVAGSDGPKGTAGFLDDRATPAQRPALEKLAAKLYAQGGPAGVPAHWQTAKITADAQPHTLKLMVGDYGGFSADVLTGRDGVTPIVVENNAVWPIKRATKAKSRRLSMNNADSGTVAGDGTNANYGAFSFASGK